jgi:peptidoglycan/xylan/chitin deacetylase (PgdA/CDA1 family)
MISSYRWGIKKLARAGVALGTRATTSLWGSIRTDVPFEIRVLTYHRFGNVPRDPFCVSARDFETQIAYLAESGHVLSLAQFDELLYGDKPPCRGAVLVTIDDGFRSTYSTALPILRHYAVPAVTFVTPSLIGHAKAGSVTADAEKSPEDYMNWHELEQLIESDVVVGSHSWTHRSLGTRSSAQVEDEVTRSREMLQRRLGNQITAFAYPFGTRADFNPMTARIIQEAGYRCAFTSQHGAVHKASNPFSLPRIKVEAGEGLWLFRLLLRGGLDAWSWVDRTLWLLQARGRD